MDGTNRLGADWGERFTGLADTYEGARPHCPPYAKKTVARYLGKRPGLVVDLGCGTGLSTAAWARDADRVIGVEPNGDMLRVARTKTAENVEFRRAFANRTGLADECADAVTCSQSFHWMEPESTLAEVDRILKPGGVFAAYDYDWPPVCGLRAELTCRTLFGAVRELEREFADPAVHWDKEKHLERMERSGYFRYTRELVFENTELFTAERLISVAKSRSGLHRMLETAPERIRPFWKEYCDAVRGIFGTGEFSAELCYRMRIGVK